MNKSSCELMLQYYPEISDVEDLHSTYIANCVFNNLLSFVAIMLNIVTIHVIRKTSSLPKTLKTLLLILAVSDVGVGLLVQPFYTSLLVTWLRQSLPSCSTYKVFFVIGLFFSLASFFGVVAVSVDRFLAIHLHLRYQELVTHKRVVAVVISIWAISALYSSMPLRVPYNIRSVLVSIDTVIGLFLTTVAYIRIYLVVRRHRNQIQALQVAQNGEMANFAGLIKSAVCTFYVYLVHLVCYLPTIIYWAALANHHPSIALKRVLLFSLTLVCLNSSFNPAIYCWKMRHIRRAIMDILRNMSWLRNRASH
ncbi:adenosine receptor A3-like [Oculina patagonica]